MNALRKFNWKFLLAVILVFWFTFALFWQSSKQSITSDEIVHLPTGYTYLTQRDFRVNPEHPVLMKA